MEGRLSRLRWQRMRADLLTVYETQDNERGTDAIYNSTAQF